MITRRLILAGSASMLASGRSAARTVPYPPNGRPSVPPAITVHFATNRNQLGDGFGTAFLDDSDKARYVTGTVEVVHTGGDPHPVWRPGKPVVDPPQSHTAAQALVEQTPSQGGIVRFLKNRERSEAVEGRRQSNFGLVFLPGFNTTFESAMSSAAQIAAAYGARAIYCFSWPSQGQFGLQPYVADRGAAYASGQAISAELALLLDRAKKTHPLLHIVCHSMGNRAFSAAVQAIRQSSPTLLSPGPKKYFKIAILIAADEDDSALRDPAKLAPLVDLSEEIDVYTNGGDWAMALSHIANFPKQPLGSQGPETLGTLPPNVVWIDCSDVGNTTENDGSSDYGHQYYRMSEPVITDIRQVLAATGPGHVRGRLKSGALPTRKFFIRFDPGSSWGKSRHYDRS